MAPSERKIKAAHQRKEPRALKRKRELEDLDKLEKAVKELDLKSPDLKNFDNLPLCEATASGLSASHYQVLTEIQARAIPQALKGDDILGAAKTGSGKTLAFLVPMLEKLYRARWTEYDGLGALIISPTRELAVQIFEVLRKIGRYHVFSAGLVVGGKSLEEEAARLGRMNILVCTPGRLLQHLDQTVGLDVNNLQMLVLDEADRILDTGFQTTVNAIIEHLPKTRQTMLFSATQNKKVGDLARLSLADPAYISVSEGAAASTPNTLQQFYMVTPLPEKLDTLYGFIKTNLKSKMIVFMSSAKQVRFVYETFRRLQPGIPLLHLHGRQKQEARLAITDHFRSAKHSCLFATDVVARGIDFPAVDWVVQLDAPEDTDTYIHRVGRTARYESKGRAVLFLDPSEQESMIQKLELKKVPITRVHPREKKKRSIANMLQDLCFKEADVKYLGQKAFISYVRSVHQQKDKDVFKVDELDLDGFAKALGLPGTPPVKLKRINDQKRLKNVSRDALSSDSDEDRKQTEVRTKYERMAQRTNQDVFTSHYREMLGGEGADADDDEDFLSVKRVLNGDQLEEASRQPTISEPKVVDLGGSQLVIDSNRREKLLKSKKKLAKLRGKGSKMVFDDDGNAHAIYELQDEDDFKAQGPEELRQQFVETEGARVREADLEDKQLAKEKRKEKRMKRKARERGEDMDESGPVALLDAPDELNGEDPLDLLRSLPMPGEGRSDKESEEEEEEERPKKKPKKWFQDDSDDDKDRGKKVVEIDHEPETLEDFEALAKGLLD